jgi:exosortase
MTSTAHHRQYLLWLGFLTMVILNLLIYRDPIADIIGIAVRDSDRSYIIVVPFLAMYLAWLRRSRIRNITLKPSILGPGIILLGWIGFLIGGTEDIVVLWHLGAIFGIVGIVVTFLGGKSLRAFGPAFFILLAVVPIPGRVRQFAAQPLQRLATDVTATILDVVGVPAVQNGNLIEINGVVVAVGEACDGMRLLVPLMLVIYVFVFSLPLRSSMRAFMILASIPVALICNVLRLVPTALAFGYMPRFAEVTHDIGGWIMIPIAILALLGLLRLIEWLDIPVSRWRLATG